MSNNAQMNVIIIITIGSGVLTGAPSDLQSLECKICYELFGMLFVKHAQMKSKLTVLVGFPCETCLKQADCNVTTGAEEIKHCPLVQVRYCTFL